MDRLHDKRQFIRQPLHILSNCGEAELVEAGMVEMSKVYDEAGRELYMRADERENYLTFIVFKLAKRYG